MAPRDRQALCTLLRAPADVGHDIERRCDEALRSLAAGALLVPSRTGGQST